MDNALRALRDACDRALSGHGPTPAADLLATILADTTVDRYRDAVARLAVAA